MDLMTALVWIFFLGQYTLIGIYITIRVSEYMIKEEGESRECFLYPRKNSAMVRGKRIDEQFRGLEEKLTKVIEEFLKEEGDEF